MKLRVENLAPKKRYAQWTWCAMPATRTAGETALVGQSLAIAGPKVSDDVQELLILVREIDALGVLEGELCWTEGMSIPAWIPAAWLARSRIAEIAWHLTEEAGGPAKTLHLTQMQVTSELVAGARFRLRFRGRIPDTMLIVDFIADLYSNQDVVPFWCQVTCADPSRQDRQQPIGELWMTSAEQPVWWTAQSRGGYVHDVLQNDLYRVDIAEGTSMGEPQALALWGSILPTPHSMATTALAPILVDHKPATTAPLPIGEAHRRITTMQAETEAPMRAMVDGWDGFWGPFGNTPKPQENWTQDVARHDAVQRIARQHLDRLGVRGNPWDSVPFGQVKDTRAAGDQHGFGVVKCAPALVGFTPSYLWVAEHSALHGMACRPVHHREYDGSHVNIQRHPEWVTWDQQTHFHGAVSPDRLGKGNGPIDTHGWSGHDRQHNQPLLSLCHYALTGDPLGRLQLEALAEKYLSEDTVPSEKPGWSTNGMDAERAVGRTLLTAAWLDFCLGDPRLMERAVKRVEEVVAAQWDGQHVEPGKVRVLGYYAQGNPPDLRVLNGKYDGWRPCFNAMGACGLLAIHERTGNEKAKEIGLAVVRTLVEHAAVYRNGVMKVPWTVRYMPGGEPLTQEQWIDPEQVQFDGGAWEWWSYAAFALGERYGVTGAAEVAAALRRDHGRPSHPDEMWRWLEWSGI